MSGFRYAVLVPSVTTNSVPCTGRSTRGSAAGRIVVRLSACSVVCVPGRSDSGHTTRFPSKNGGWVWPWRITRTCPVERSASLISTSPPGPYPWAQAA